MKAVRWGLVALAASLAAPAMAADSSADNGRIKANTCMGCHGIPGYNNAYPTYRVPKLGGQNAKFLEAALKAYRSGERPHGTMHAQAANLSDADIADIAAFLASPPAHNK